MKKLLLLILPFFACNSNTPSDSQDIDFAELDSLRPLQTIAFGSCNKQFKSQEMWDYIIAEDPELWIWLGDNIYGDSRNMSVLKRKYELLKFHPKYIDLLQQCPVIGTWDDHDYGVNDGGKEFSKKEQSKALMLDFLDVPEEAEVRTRREGVYQSFLYGPKGKQVKIILLDTRYFRDNLRPDPSSQHRYKPNLTGDILGEEQWQWLQQELASSTAQVHIIGSSIQVIPEEHFFEKWANFPTARQRFMDLMKAHRPANLILLSGDRHVAELSKINNLAEDFNVYEVTSSGLTHARTSPERLTEPNQYRIGSVVNSRNYGILKIDWSEDTPEVTVQIKGLKRKLFFEEQLKF